QEGFALEDLDVVAEVEPVVRRNLERHALDLRSSLQRRDRHPEKREEDHDGAAGEREGDEPAEMYLTRGQRRRSRQRGRGRERTHVRSLPESGSSRKSRVRPRFISTRQACAETAIAATSPPSA